MKERYAQVADSLWNDCQMIDSDWLIARYPGLWRHLVLLDGQLTRLEPKATEGNDYEAMLEKLVQTVKKVRALYEKKEDEQWPQRSKS